MNIVNISKEFKNIAEWASYCKSLEATILKLTKEINTFKEKNEQLEEIIKKTIPIIETEEQKKLKAGLTDVSDEEAIAIMELAKLKEISLQRDLNMDEAKRVDLFAKLLIQKRGVKVPGKKTDAVADDELLKILVDNE